MKKNSIAVIGAGKWGSALHFALSEKQEVFITSRTPKDIKNPPEQLYLNVLTD